MIADELRTLLLAEPVLDAVIDGRVFTSPLKRVDERDPDLASSPATPEAFDTLPPYYIRPSIVVGDPRSVADVTTPNAGTMARRWVVTLAYYTAPDLREAIEQMVWYASVAIGRRWIDLPSGHRGRVVVPPFTTSVVPVPEMPAAGMMATGEVEIAYAALV